MNQIVQLPANSKLEPIDCRLAFLERASSRLLLVKAGAMELGEAFDGLVCSLQCPCEREILERWERISSRGRR